MQDSFLQAFVDRWTHVHAMTRGLVESVSEACWHSSPLPGFAPLAKQVRHVVCVRGVYNEGLRSGRVEFDRKHEFSRGDLERASLASALDEAHRVLLVELEDLQSDPFEPAIDFFGNRVSYARTLYGYVQHEAIHHGPRSLYAASGGYETRALWRPQWGLGAGAV